MRPENQLPMSMGQPVPQQQPQTDGTLMELLRALGMNGGGAGAQMTGTKPQKEARLGRLRTFLENVIAGVGSGYTASAGAPAGQRSAAGIGAALTTPIAMGRSRQQYADEQENQRRTQLNSTLQLLLQGRAQDRLAATEKRKEEEFETLNQPVTVTLPNGQTVTGPASQLLPKILTGEYQLATAKNNQAAANARNEASLNARSIEGEANRNFRRGLQDVIGQQRMSQVERQGQLAMDRAQVMAAAQGPATIQTQDETGRGVTLVTKGRLAGRTFPLPPTSQSRSFQDSISRSMPVIDQIDELSQRINTQAGIIATITGVEERVAAEFNYNNDVAVYQGLISGFTPLVAKALGHVGVLTQLDVDSVKKLFPRPEDSKSLRDRKIAQIRTLLDVLQSGSYIQKYNSGSKTFDIPDDGLLREIDTGGGGRGGGRGNGGGSGSGGGGVIRLQRGPDGKLREVRP